MLPDTEEGAHLAAGLGSTPLNLSHASGRPWVVGSRAPEGIAVGSHGDTRVAVIGEHRVTPEQAARAAAGGPAAWGEAGRMWPGSFHLLVSEAGRVRVQGSAVGLRRVFYGTVPGPGRCVLAADRADVIAELTGAGLDERRVAVELLTSGAPHPLTGAPLWHGVHALPSGHRLTLEPGSRTAVSRWWHVPSSEVPLSEGAEGLRTELRAAVEVRTHGRSLVTTDLGGLDSTAVCCTAARGPATVAAYTAALHDQAGDDVYWAERTVQELPGVEHHIVPAADVAMTFEGVDSLQDVLDTPSIITVDRNRRMGIIERAAARGSGLHLCGLGGDELLAGTPAHLHSLLRTHPRTGLRALRGYTAKYRWPYSAVLRQLGDRRPYRAWLARVADDLTAPAPAADEPLLDWAAPPRMPPWATGDARAAARELLRAELPTAQPLAPGHGTHRELAAMEGISQWARHIGQMAAPLGLTFSAPYYDVRVIEAALAVRPHERITPWRYKPLIVEAMRGVVPESSRTRGTKANATYEEEAGLRAHRAGLLALCEDSRLARLGLVDEGELRRWCLRALSAESESYQLHPTLACEVWLRTRERLASQPPEAVRQPEQTAGHSRPAATPTER